MGVHPRSILIKTEGGRKDSRTDGAISTDNGLSFSGRRASRAVVYLPSFLPSFLPYLCLLAEAPFAHRHAGDVAAAAAVLQRLSSPIAVLCASQEGNPSFYSFLSLLLLGNFHRAEAN